MAEWQKFKFSTKKLVSGIFPTSRDFFWSEARILNNLGWQPCYILAGARLTCVQRTNFGAYTSQIKPYEDGWIFIFLKIN